MPPSLLPYRLLASSACMREGRCNATILRGGMQALKACAITSASAFSLVISPAVHARERVVSGLSALGACQLGHSSFLKYHKIAIATYSSEITV